MKKSISFLILALISVIPVLAQERPDPQVPQGENLQVPEGWEVRLDRENPDVVIGADPESADIYFVNMTPGWHITSGPAAICYHPANTASGNYTVKSSLHRFDPGGRDREAFGIFIGGKNLDAENQEYIYFLIRNTGDYLIKKRTGANTSVIKDWSPSDTIVIYDDGTEEASVQNDLAIGVEGDTVRFFINNEEVYSLSEPDVDKSGIFGLRVNHSINIHVEDLSLES